MSLHGVSRGNAKCSTTKCIGFRDIRKRNNVCRPITGGTSLIGYCSEQIIWGLLFPKFCSLIPDNPSSPTVNRTGISSAFRRQIRRGRSYVGGTQQVIQTVQIKRLVVRRKLSQLCGILEGKRRVGRRERSEVLILKLATKRAPLATDLVLARAAHSAINNGRHPPAWLLMGKIDGVFMVDLSFCCLAIRLKRHVTLALHGRLHFLYSTEFWLLIILRKYGLILLSRCFRDFSIPRVIFLFDPFRNLLQHIFRKNTQ